MSRARVFGVGQPLLADDGVAARVLERLDRRFPTQLAVSVDPAWAESLAASERVAFVDAAVDLPPGAIRERDVHPARRIAAYTHQFGPSECLALAAAYGRIPEARLFTVGAADFTPGQGLSPVVAAAVPQLAAAVSKYLEETGQPTRAEG